MSRRSKKATISKTAPPRHRGAAALGSENRSIGLNDRWMIFGVCLFLGAITWLVFGQTLHFQFINYDDNEYVYKNAQVARGLTIEGIVWAFTHVHSANWHPLTWLSHMLDCQLYGLNPGGHHLTNVLIHAATAILLFLVLRQMTGALWRSAFVAAVFAIHPLRVESVAWVAERKDVLSGLFFVLTIGAYVRYARRPWSPVRYGLVVLLFALGLMCKPMLVTLPFVLLLLDYWPLNRVTPPADRDDKKVQSPRNLVVEKLPLLALATASCVTTLFAQKVALQPLANISIMARMGNALISYIVYLRQTFWPSGLAVLYPFAVRDVVASRVLLSLALLVCISLVIFLLRRRLPYLVTGWLWYVIMLGPVIGILQVGDQSRADRYTYLPQIGLLLLLTWMAADLSVRWRHRRLIFSALSTIVLMALAFSARVQAAYWQNGLSLWTRALACTADNVVAEQNLGQTVHEQGRVDEAITHFEKALQINPSQASVHSSLSVALLEIGRVDESLAHLQTALALDPHDGDAHYNMGNTLMELGQAGEALVHYNTALQINPDDTQALNNMAWMLATWPDAMIRDGTKAVALAERAVLLTDNTEPRAVATLAAALAETARFPDAVKTAERAAQLARDEGNLALADSIRGQGELYRASLPFRDRRYSSTR
jgi:tetratricopeptide (TPR) repeat protein